MEFHQTDLPGCLSIRARTLADERGSFMKTYNAPDYLRTALRREWPEEIHTSSRRGVVRGMHFQTPPTEQAKMVFCVVGEVFDVVVDLRRGSPTYLQHRSFTLRADDGAGLYVPSGLAHGFAALGDVCTMFYKLGAAFAPANDAGIAWDGFGCDWPVREPILSARDYALPALAAFESPFVFDAEQPER